MKRVEYDIDMLAHGLDGTEPAAGGASEGDAPAAGGDGRGDATGTASGASTSGGGRNL